MSVRKRKPLLALSMAICAFACVFAVLTLASLQPAPDLAAVYAQSDRISLLDRHGNPLTVSYQSLWNLHDRVPLYAIPAFLQAAFIQAEDRRFFEHSGQDWRARLHAVWQNLRQQHAVRGASTITEQVVRLLHPRPRNLWSKWLEGWEAERLERRYAKAELLEFYLNQVPYAANRRGVVQAARYYFDRDLDTLSRKEMLALAVLVRAPSRLDIYRDRAAVDKPLSRLALQMRDAGWLDAAEYAALADERFSLATPQAEAAAQHFMRHVLQQRLPATQQLQTTLDSALQTQLQGILDQQLTHLQQQHVENGGLLVADHHNGDILAWVVAGANDLSKPASAIDSVTALRQPGSALKPMLYAAALEKGWTAATLIEDAPLSEMVGQGVHNYHNYSRTFYGWVSVREALGNSLNIPALKAVQFVGIDDYLAILKSLGFKHLTRHPNYYGDGLALGNAEVSLLEMVQAYATLANRGVARPLRVLQQHGDSQTQRRVFSEMASSLLGNILSDPAARQLEFGNSTVLNLPVQTAIKTGTSSDFRDSWALGYNDRYVVGVWLGNLDNSATDGVTGSTGAGLVLRSTFALLNRQRETRPLYLSPQLLRLAVCKSTGRLLSPDVPCATPGSELFIPGHIPETAAPVASAPSLRIRQPSEGLLVAFDPRVSAARQALEFILQGAEDSDRVSWTVDGESLGEFSGGRHLWPLRRGKHVVQARLNRNGATLYQSPEVEFWVK